ncbi:MAG: acyl-CoA synthetase [Pseudomonadota bacterium]
MAQSAFSNMSDRNAIEAASTYEARETAPTMRQMITRVAESFGDRPAVSYQITSGPKDKSETLTWAALRDRSFQAANLFRGLGIGETDVVAYIMPNANEALATLIGGSIAGIVEPINPLLDAEQIAGILHGSGAQVVVTLKSFPKTDIAQKIAEAVAMAPSVHHVLEVDLNRYLTPPKSWIVPLIRPKHQPRHNAKVLDFNAALDAQPTALTFPETGEDRVAAYFHTGGTTGTPKVAQHKYSGMAYNGWLGHELLFTEHDVVMCPLPMFHVFACHVIMMGALTSGAHVVFPTPAGYRGEGVFDNFWKLCERYGVTFIITVPTAVSAMMQRPVDADISTVKRAFSGSAPMPMELFKRFEGSTGIEIIEGYGLTECTCLVACNPLDGDKKVGSVGIPFPYTDVKIFDETSKEVEPGMIGEICVSNPGVFAGSTYTSPDKNRDLFHHEKYLRTGDLGKIDADGYLWITGRAKDLIIRGGHNIDPAEIEEVLAMHPAVAFVGAIGQPDRHSGEIPSAYVELLDGADASCDDLAAYAAQHIGERAAVPKYVEILDELPKTAVGKIFKPDLRRLAITRVVNASLQDAGLSARIVAVIEDPKRGLVAHVDCDGEEDAVASVFDSYTIPWAVNTSETEAA